MTKPRKWHMRPVKTEISLAIRPDWSESSLCAQWIAKDPSFRHGDSKDWSYWADAQADLSLHWAHMPLCRFCHALAHFSDSVWFVYFQDILYQLRRNLKVEVANVGRAAIFSKLQPLGKNLFPSFSFVHSEWHGRLGRTLWVWSQAKSYLKLTKIVNSCSLTCLSAFGRM